MTSVLHLAAAQLRMYVRDRQSVFFGLFFPVFFMLALGFLADAEPEPVDVAVVRAAPESDSADPLIAALSAQELLDITEEDKETARAKLEDVDYALVLMLPEKPILERAQDAADDGPIAISVLVNAAQPQRTQQALTVLNAVLASVENDIRQTEPLFRLDVEDVLARNVRYVDFLVPGLLAFMVLQLSIAGSGFNLVEYKRKGILKRLFVTPLRPIEFVASLVGARLVVVLVQISLLLVVAKLIFDISLEGSLLLVYLFVILGSILFLSLGFALGGIAKTQSAIMAFGNLVIFPQVFLASVFFPLEALPEWLRPVAAILPLSFVADAIRRVANEGALLGDLGADLLGIAAWTAVCLALAVAMFNWNEAANAPPAPR
jgi:ABC-2 type transport system permease protein